MAKTEQRKTVVAEAPAVVAEAPAVVAEAPTVVAEAPTVVAEAPAVTPEPVKSVAAEILADITVGNLKPAGKGMGKGRKTGRQLPAGDCWSIQLPLNVVFVPQTGGNWTVGKNSIQIVLHVASRSAVIVGGSSYSHYADSVVKSFGMASLEEVKAWLAENKIVFVPPCALIG